MENLPLKPIASIIEAASKSILGVISLIILAFTGLAYVFFKDEEVPTKLYSFGIAVGFFMLVLSILLNINKLSKPQPDPNVRLLVGCFKILIAGVLLAIFLVIAGYGFYYYMLFEQFRKYQPPYYGR